MNDELPSLRRALDGIRVVWGEEAAQSVRSDWSGVPAGSPLAIAHPGTPEEVSRVVQACHLRDIPVAIQGGRTGLAGGAVPEGGEVVLALDRLNRIEEIDTSGATALVQAGVTLEALNSHLEPLGLQFALDLGARGSCHLGGNAATNAGGNRVVRYGTMRNLVLGVEAVLADGSVLSDIKPLTKNTTGLDLKQLFIGTEGTLGVIARLRLKLHPRAAVSHTALVKFSPSARLPLALQDARRRLNGLSAFEVMWGSYYARACAAVNVAPLPPQDDAVFALIEDQHADPGASVQPLESLLGAWLESNVAEDAVVAQSLQQANELWSVRDAISELLPAMKPFVAFDVSIPAPRMEDFVKSLEQRLQKYVTASHLFFGHIGDDNLHLVTGPHEDQNEIEALEHLVYSQVQAVGGSISGEHGIGRLKKPFLSYSRSLGEMTVMRQVKRALDPRSILNRHCAI